MNKIHFSKLTLLLFNTFVPEHSRQVAVQAGRELTAALTPGLSHPAV